MSDTQVVVSYEEFLQRRVMFYDDDIPAYYTPALGLVKETQQEVKVVDTRSYMDKCLDYVVVFCYKLCDNLVDRRPTSQEIENGNAD